MQVGALFIVSEITHVDSDRMAGRVSIGDDYELMFDCRAIDKPKVGNKYIITSSDINSDVFVLGGSWKYNGYHPAGTRLVPKGYVYTEGDMWGYYLSRARGVLYINYDGGVLGEAVADPNQLFAIGRPDW